MVNLTKSAERLRFYRKIAEMNTLPNSNRTHTSATIRMIQARFLLLMPNTPLQIICTNYTPFFTKRKPILFAC